MLGVAGVTGKVGTNGSAHINVRSNLQRRATFLTTEYERGRDEQIARDKTMAATIQMEENKKFQAQLFNIARKEHQQRQSLSQGLLPQSTSLLAATSEEENISAEERSSAQIHIQLCKLLQSDLWFLYSYGNVHKLKCRIWKSEYFVSH